MNESKKRKENIILITQIIAIPSLFIAFLVSIIGFLSSCNDATAQSSTTLEFRYPKTEKYEGKCEICGAPVYEYREENNYYDNGFFINTSPYYFTDSPLYKLSFSQTIEVCKDCAKKYEEKFNEKMLSVWISLLIEAQDENKDKRKDFELKAKNQKETEIKNKIEQLKDDLRELNGKPRKNKVNTLRFYNSFTDSITTKNILAY